LKQKTLGKTMNSSERVQNRLSGRRVDRIPNFNIMMMFAAHYIGKPLSSYYLDYRVLCEANFAVQRDFQLDILQAISDPYREAADLGLEVDFPADNLPISKRPLIRETSDLVRLSLIAPESGRRMSDRIDAIACFKQKAGGQIPIMGWVEGALAEAADLRGVTQIMMDVYDNPEWLEQLLDFCCQLEIDFAGAQVSAGADIIGLGDAVASQVGPAAYRRFALPYEKRIFAAVHEMGALCRLHICGDTSSIVHDMAESGADMIDVDWMVDMKRAADAFGEKVAICGNQDPTAVMLLGSPDHVRVKVRESLEKGGPRCFSSAGCEIPDKTPHQNLRAQNEVLADARYRGGI
jgi:MtaA/CmuA family methyltransferase